MATCVNCKAKIDYPHMFQDLDVCINCYKIATHKLDEAKRIMSLVVQLYAETLRVALIKGECHLPMLPKDDTMPLSELDRALKIAGEINAHHTQGHPKNNR